MPETHGDVVLIGGGHTHIQVMTAFAASPEPGMRLVLISEQPEAAYSGMLPGHLSGLYRRDEMQIDLVALAVATGTTLIQARATGIDLDRRQVLCEGREPVKYRLLSINVGITPDLSAIAGAERHGLAVKPISSFLNRFDAVLGAAADSGRLRDIAVVGNGAAGVELAFALAARLRGTGQTHPSRNITLIGSGPVVSKLNSGVRCRVRSALDRHGIARRDGVRIVAIDADAVVTADGERITADTVFISTRARAPHWLGATGLALTPNGSIATAPTLQVAARDDVFAVGDCAEILGHPREKAGVFAVRQGPVLARNIRARWCGEALETHRPQTDYLIILMTGDGRAITGRGHWLAAEGRWVWWLKDWIDRRFIDRFKTRSSI
ncbi:MAG: FAD-dependent oxidoreductase [Afipia sp.]|nr:FAD-dependent oxidoreductase [Afipia sp.]